MNWDPYIWYMQISKWILLDEHPKKTIKTFSDFTSFSFLKKLINVSLLLELFSGNSLAMKSDIYPCADELAYVNDLGLHDCFVGEDPRPSL